MEQVKCWIASNLSQSHTRPLSSIAVFESEKDYAFYAEEFALGESRFVGNVRDMISHVYAMYNSPGRFYLVHRKTSPAGWALFTNGSDYMKYIQNQRVDSTQWAWHTFAMPEQITFLEQYMIANDMTRYVPANATDTYLPRWLVLLNEAITQQVDKRLSEIAQEQRMRPSSPLLSLINNSRSVPQAILVTPMTPKRPMHSMVKPNRSSQDTMIGAKILTDSVARRKAPRKPHSRVNINQQLVSAGPLRTVQLSRPPFGSPHLSVTRDAESHTLDVAPPKTPSSSDNGSVFEPFSTSSETVISESPPRERMAAKSAPSRRITRSQASPTVHISGSQTPIEISDDEGAAATSPRKRLRPRRVVRKRDPIVVEMPQRRRKRTRL